jgi:NADPH-dependent curcumin reductase
MTSLAVTLATRPVGMVKDSDFQIQEITKPSISEGQVLIKNKYISIDPAIRGWMNAGRTYIDEIPVGGVIRAFAAGEVVESLHPDFAVGDTVEGMLGASAWAISDGKGLTKLDLLMGTLSAHLGVLGMPGMTAYFGLLDRANPQAGETVFVSGAAGIIGTTVGQIAKIKGCKVVGTAGGADKCQYLLDLGFDIAIDYKNADVNAELKKHCPEGIHVFYDNVGGDILDIALANLGRGARVIICGAISQYNDMSQIQGPKNYMKIVSARGEMKGIIVFDYLSRYPEARADMAAWIANGQLQYKEHVVEGLENFPAALRMLFEGKNFGKLLVKV